jgi:hypothetical protein
MFFIKQIPQDTEYHRSFNVFVPLAIQGKPCCVVSIGGIAKDGSIISHKVSVEGKNYFIPAWALGERVF